MSLRYHFRGADAEQLRRMRAAAAHAVGGTLSCRAPVDPERDARHALVAGVAAFSCLELSPELPHAGPMSPATGDCGGVPPRAAAADSGAVDRAIAHLDGDGTPWSYLCASVLRRELQAAMPLAPRLVDLPAWEQQELLDEAPPGSELWTWLTAAPTDWRLLVMEDTRRVLVRMYTLAVPGSEVAVLVHEDWYRRGEGYEARGAARPLARWGQPPSQGGRLSASGPPSSR